MKYFFKITRQRLPPKSGVFQTTNCVSESQTKAKHDEGIDFELQREVSEDR